MAILRRVSAVTCVLACSVTVTACDLIREPLAVTLTEDRAVVMSVLSAGDSIARVLLTIVPAMADPFDPYDEPDWIPIADAHVRLVAGVDTITLVAQPGAEANACVAGPVHDGGPAAALLPGCYVGTVPGGIRSGASYALIADLPARGRVEGHTTVPVPPVILQPVSGATIDARTNGSAPDPILVAWSGVAAGSLVELRLISTNPECSVHMAPGTGLGQLTRLRVLEASEAEIRVRMSCPTSVTETAGEILLTAFDTAYSRYSLTMFENHEMADASAGLTGPAIGALGSVATVRHPVQFVRE